MPVPNYITGNGMLLGEETNGVRIDYMTDALGNVTGRGTNVKIVTHSLSATWISRQ